jgi:hypothetical protein
MQDGNVIEGAIERTCPLASHDGDIGRAISLTTKLKRGK